MMTRIRPIAIISGIAAVAIVVGLLYFQVGTKSTPVEASTPWTDHPIANLSDEAKTQYAVDYVLANYTNDVTPTVKLAKSLTPDQLYDLGLNQPGGSYLDNNVALYTVILQGSFNLNQPGQTAANPKMPKRTTYTFLQLGFDDNGHQALIHASEDGTGFKKALNDPSLPDDPAPPLRMSDLLKNFQKNCPYSADPAQQKPCTTS